MRADYDELANEADEITRDRKTRTDMSNTNEQDRKKLSLSSGRGKLSLGKSVETGQVKQSFSHGRSKTVQV